LRNDDPALLHAQQSLAQIIASSSSSTSNGASDLYKDGNNAAVSDMCATATGAEPCSVMDLLNMAFVKGREEGCKFLPKDNNRLVMKDTTRNGRLEADAETTGRACKLMATMARPEEEAQVQELIGRMMLDDCEVPTEEMERLRAAMADEAAMSNSREARRRQQQQVDMRTLLVSCAQAVDERHGARELLEQAKQHASPTGDATQRLAHCFVEALEARLAGTGSVLHRSASGPPRPRRWLACWSEVAMQEPTRARGACPLVCSVLLSCWCARSKRLGVLGRFAKATPVHAGRRHRG